MRRFLAQQLRRLAFFVEPSPFKFTDPPTLYAWDGKEWRILERSITK